MSAAGDERVSTLGLGNHRGTKLGGTRASRASRASHASRFSTASKMSKFSSFSSFSAVPGLAEAGQDFRHHFGTSGALQPKIVGKTGAKATLRDDVEMWDDSGNLVEQEKAKKASIPKDIRLPAFLILLTGFCNNASYTLEFATFAIYFKQVHNWNEALWASLAQTSGDVMAAIAMQLLPRIFSGEYDWDEASSCMRFCHHVLSQPYALSFALFTWVICELGMMSPVLALAIVAQVFMGSSYVYTSKFATDMNLFYSLGDSNVFLALQTYTRSADALGGCLAGIAGTYLFTLNPIAPFALGAFVSSVVFALYTIGFCRRLGFGDDIESAEAKRSRRMGLRRVSSWASEASSVRKSQSSRKSLATIQSVGDDLGLEDYGLEDEKGA